MKHQLTTVCLAFMLALPAGAQVYKTTDENGRVTYTDRPSDRAEQVELRETNSAPAVNTPDRSEVPNEATTELAPYRVYITSPEPGTTLTPGERDLVVSYEANQALAPGLRFQLLSNGQPIGRSTTGNSIAVPEITRGEHALTVIIYDQNDRVLAESGALNIYVHRSIAPKPAPRGGS